MIETLIFLCGVGAGYALGLGKARRREIAAIRARAEYEDLKELGWWNAAQMYRISARDLDLVPGPVTQEGHHARRLDPAPRD